MSTELLGSYGEERAADYLRKKRYTIAGMNFRTRLGEIDLICEDRRFIVFVEVKLRKNDRYGSAREFVTRRKQERVIAAAKQWLQIHPTRKQPRFDVIEVYAPEGADPRTTTVVHLMDAFSADRT